MKASYGELCNSVFLSPDDAMKYSMTFHIYNGSFISSYVFALTGSTIFAILPFPCMCGNTKARAGTEQLKVNKPAADNLETQPMDVMRLSPPESLPVTSSPEVPTEKLRQRYQQVAGLAQTPDMGMQHDIRFECQ